MDEKCLVNELEGNRRVSVSTGWQGRKLEEWSDAISHRKIKGKKEGTSMAK